MDAVCVDSDWDVALAEDKDGNIIGALPFQVQRKWGVKAAFTPLVTPHSGPWYNRNTDKPLHQQISAYHQIVNQLAQQLDPFTYKNINLAPSDLPGHAWYWKGYQLHTRYTYRLIINSKEEVFAQCKNTIRTDIRNAEKDIEIAWVGSAEEFYDLIKRQVGGHYQLLSAPTVKNLFNLQKQFSLRVNKAIRGGKTMGMALFAIDGSDIYYLVGGRQTEGYNLGLTALLWDSITEHAGPDKVLDFEGTMLKKVEPFFRRFGGVPTPYLNVVKMPRWMYPFRG